MINRTRRHPDFATATVFSLPSDQMGETGPSRSAGSVAIP